MIFALIVLSLFCQAQDLEFRLYDAAYRNDIASITEILKQHPELVMDSRIGEVCLFGGLRHQASDPAIQKLVLDNWQVALDQWSIYNSLKFASDRADTRTLGLLLHTRALKKDRKAFLRLALDAAILAPDDSAVRYLVEAERIFEILTPAELTGDPSWGTRIGSASAAPLAKLTEHAPQIWGCPADGLLFAVTENKRDAFNSILRTIGGRDAGVALEKALSDGRLEYVHPLLVAGTDPNVVRTHCDPSRDRVSQALLIAVREGYVDIVLDLLRHGANLTEDAFGFAMGSRDDEMFKALIRSRPIPIRIESESIAAKVFVTIATLGDWALLKRYLMSTTFPRAGIIDLTSVGLLPTTDSSLLIQDPELFTIVQVMGSSMEHLGVHLTFVEAEKKLEQTVMGARSGDREAVAYLNLLKAMQKRISAAALNR